MRCPKRYIARALYPLLTPTATCLTTEKHPFSDSPGAGPAHGEHADVQVERLLLGEGGQRGLPLAAPSGADRARRASPPGAGRRPELVLQNVGVEGRG
jgi:hypothetical protein